MHHRSIDRRSGCTILLALCAPPLSIGTPALAQAAAPSPATAPPRATEAGTDRPASPGAASPTAGAAAPNQANPTLATAHSSALVNAPGPVSIALAGTADEPLGPPEPVVRSGSSLLALALDRPARYEKQLVAPGSMEAMSMFAVRSPEQRKFMRHDLVQIIVRETSRATADQTLDTKKDYGITGEVAWANFSFDAFGQPGVATSSGQHDAPVFEALGRKRLKGEGEYDRTDEFTTRMTAEIIEVLPNGNLILEARTTIQNDKEATSIKLTGICRPDDITSANTVLSNQVHDLKIEKMNTGFVKDAADKGIIAQVLDAILAF